MPDPAKRGWLKCNWKWFVPVVVLVCVVGQLFLIMYWTKSSDVYKEALLRAKASTEVTAALGTPLKAGYFVIGQFDYTKINGSEGFAVISIPISGPKVRANLHVEASNDIRIISLTTRLPMLCCWHGNPTKSRSVRGTSAQRARSL